MVFGDDADEDITKLEFGTPLYQAPNPMLETEIERDAWG